jgi:hypothetical protein
MSDRIASLQARVGKMAEAQRAKSAETAEIGRQRRARRRKYVQQHAPDLAAFWADLSRLFGEDTELLWVTHPGQDGNPVEQGAHFPGTAVFPSIPVKVKR